jgi:sulfate transport system ATP-binding protein
LARAVGGGGGGLLLDEPFGALDAKVRQGLRAWLRKLHEEIHVTSILVTHDQEEALEVADRVVVMNHGQIEQIGTPEEVFHKPATQFVMEFLGQVNVFHGRVHEGKTLLEGMALDYPHVRRSNGQAAKVYMRPHELDIKLLPNGAPHMAAYIERINPAGSIAKVTAKTLEGRQVLVDLNQETYQRLRLRNGDRVYIYPKNARVFLPEPEYAI